jgi:transposase
VVAARIIADVGDVARFADRNRFASWTGTELLDGSYGEQNRHRLSRAGNRRIDHMIHIAAVTQIRLDTEAAPSTDGNERPARSPRNACAVDLGN